MTEINFQSLFDPAPDDLQKSNALFADLFNHNPAALTINNSKGQIINCNNAFLTLFGFSGKEEVIGRTSTELNMQTDPAQVGETFKLINEKGFVKDREICIRTKSGNIIWVSSSIIKINIDNEPCFLTVSIDISERKKAEEQLRAANKELEAFTYSVSHDLLAPLRAVNGYAQMFSDKYGDKIDPESARILNKIMSSAKKMGMLINDLLSFSRLGRQELVRMNISMRTLVEEVWNELKLQENGRDINLRIKDLPPANADSVTMKQVWVNLISNALKYSRQKEKTIIEIGSEVKEGETIYYIKDNGAGFDMRYADKLFGVFQRLHTEKEFEGTGVGLAIVQRIIARHGGRIWANAELNKGAEFYFSLSKT